MTFAPSQLLDKLEELKQWQGNYDAVLKQKSNRRDGYCQADYDTIKGISAFESHHSPKKSPLDPDKRIISPIKPFEQLLEEKLAEDKSVVQVKAKPKKPFLRKGQGLVRYRMNMPIEVNKNSKNFTERRSPSNFSKANAASTKSIEDLRPSNKFYFTDIDHFIQTADILTPLKMPELVIKPKGTWQKVTDITESKDMIKTSDPVNENCNEKVKIIPKQKRKSPVKPQYNSHIMDKINEFALKHFLPKRELETIKGTSDTDPNELPNTPGEQTLYELQLEKDLRAFEILEQRAEHSSFCSTNTSIINLLSSTPNKANSNYFQRNDIENIDEDILVDYQCLNVSSQKSPNYNDKFLQEKMDDVTKKTAILQKFLVNLRKINEKKRAKKNSNTSGKSTPSPNQKHITPESSFSYQEKWSTTTPSGSQTPFSMFTETTESDTTYKDDTVTKLNAGTNTSFDQPEEKNCENCEQLKLQLDKLKKKCKDIESEKNKVEDELQCERTRIEREMQKYKKKHEDDLKELQEELDSERKKFTKQKTTFEKYMKDSQNRPNRKEREEITKLKQEVVELKEMIKLKDAKHGATQARLRNQIKQMEKENTEHKSEIEKLQKENGKLNANQRMTRRPSEVKILHQINKNLTKLTEETFKKQISCVASGGDAEKMNTSNMTKIDDKQDKVFEEVLVKMKDISNNTNKKRNSSFENEIVPLHDASDFAKLPLERQYQIVFGEIHSPKTNHNTSNNSSVQDKIEKIFPDGSMEVTYTNGNVKTISPDGNFIRIKYFNGDIKETNIKDKTIRYFYLENNCWHTQNSDGSETIEYPDGQKQKKYLDGKIEINYPEGSFRTINSDGTEEEIFPDGTKTIKSENGEQIILLPNGQKEVHTDNHKRREYPDGTIRTLYKDGTVETRYPNGRVRVKDSCGALIMDTNEHV